MKQRTISTLLIWIMICSLFFESYYSTAYSDNTLIYNDFIDPIDKIDPEILDYINSKGGIDSIEEEEFSKVIVMFYDQYTSSDFVLPEYLTLINHLSIINGFLGRLKLNMIFHLAENNIIRSIWFDHAHNSIPTEEQKNALSGFLSSANNDDNGEFMNFTGEIGAHDLWDKGINGSGVVIAIMDSGVDLTGQMGGDLDDFDDDMNTTDMKVVGTVSLVPEEPLYYTDFTGRGTFHAGLACGTGALTNTSDTTNKSYSGVAPGASYLNVKIYDSIGLTFWSFMISGIDWAIQHSADILLFCASIPGIYMDPISVAISNCINKGMVVVVPTGDDGPSYMSVLTPGGAFGPISVGAYNMHLESLANFSGRGVGLDFNIIPDIIAPGVDLIGPRAQIISNGTISMASNLGDMMGGIGGMGVGGEEESSTSFSMPDGLFPKPTYGTPINTNYTKNSGTGAAAAVVAGALALLIEAFPLANPQLLRTAICDTARSITGILNQEGCGILNVSAAYNFLFEYFGESNFQKQPFSLPLIYMGVISTSNSSDWNVTDPLNPNPIGESNISNINCYEMNALFSTQALMDAVIITNTSGGSNETMDFTQIHLPFNQFGLQFDGSNHWFSEFLVVREFHQMTQTNIGEDDYNRYLGILELNGLYVTVILESWNYVADENPDQLDIVEPIIYHDRVNAYKISFKVWNLKQDQSELNDIMLISYFKADLYLNETEALSGDMNDTESGALGGDMMSIMDFGLDDNITFDPNTQTMVVSDMNNNSYFGSKYSKKYTSMGYNSTTHNVSSYKIADSIGLLMNLTMNTTENSNIDNSSNYIRGEEDPGFLLSYNLTESGALSYGEAINFESIYSFGLGDDAVGANQSLFEQMSYVKTNCSFVEFEDIIVVKADFNRMTIKNEIYSTNSLVFNVGTVMVNSCEIIFAASRITENNDTEMFLNIKSVEYFGLNDYFSIDLNWTPGECGIYTVAWVATVMNLNEEQLMELMNGNFFALLEAGETEDNLLNNALSRSLYVYERSFYESICYDTFRAYPNKIDQEPMKIHFPGDIGLYNITTYNIIDIPEVTVSLDGPGSTYLMMMWNGPDLMSSMGGTGNTEAENAGGEASDNSTSGMGMLETNDTLYIDLLKPLSKIFIIALGPMFCPQGFVRFNISFSSPAYENEQEDGIFYQIPVEFEFREYRGRVLFDSIHNFLFMASNFSSMMSGEDMDINLDNFIDMEERLDYIYANYNDLRSLWGQNEPKGVAVQTFIPGININMSDMMGGMMETSEAQEAQEEAEDTAEEIESETGGMGGMGEMDMDISMMGDMLGGYYFESDILSTDTINHDILQFFDVLVINDPEMDITVNETRDIIQWVEAGGSLFVWCENQTENQVDSLNDLLYEFNLSISEDSDNNGSQKFVKSYMWNRTSEIFPFYNDLPQNDPNWVLEFTDPVNISVVEGGLNNSNNGKVEILCEYVAVAERGRGRMCLVGDKNMFNIQGLLKGNNSDFADTLIDFGLESYFDLNITARNSTVEMWEYNYFRADIENYNDTKDYLDEGCLFITSFIFEDSTQVNISIYGIELPMFIMFETVNEGSYATYYDTTWYNKTGTYYAMFLIDHPAAAQEMVYIEFLVIGGAPPEEIVVYEFPQPEYPHWIDLLGILWIVGVGLILWLYETEKWKTRLRIIQIKGAVLNQAKTKLNEGKSLLRQILRGLEVTEDEQEQMRLILASRKNLAKYLKELKKFGEDIGEHYE
ncbi:MAG: S8 family serine peptidase [archaeon]|nr:S8 family serine peptidase [archaeon]